ncbi:hypothetical protein M569_08491 [Genlisea aurea]|uniref:Serine-rich protein-like protein n=1 Tax=Genlisea aurea TaxID=192259 RepID=S8DSW6_9LAMI|nr:hypothetical protein M569_08491 [Genlisea aurea]
MAASSSRRKPESAFQRSGPFSSSPFMASGGFTASSSFASSSSYYSSSVGGFFDRRRSASPTRVSLHAPPPTSSVRFSIDRSISPSRSIAAPPPRNPVIQRSCGSSIQKRTCLCSPTTHPGSFRCSLHRNSYGSSSGGGRGGEQSIPYSPNRLNMRRSAMTNSLVRIGTVEGDLVKRALAALIHPSSHQQRRRVDFQARPSRLSVMSKADEKYLR